jgi:hypothetical protein
MGTAYNGTFVISWSQTTIDTLQSAPVDFLKVGVTWGWEGEAVRVDGPNDLLRLDDAEGEADRRKRAARMVRRLVGAAIEDTTDLSAIAVDHPIADKCFVLTDGRSTYTVYTDRIRHAQTTAADVPEFFAAEKQRPVGRSRIIGEYDHAK